MPIAEAGPQLEALIRQRVFTHVLQPLAPHYLPEPHLPEHLEFNDLFFVKYSAQPGAQCDLQVHTRPRLHATPTHPCTHTHTQTRHSHPAPNPHLHPPPSHV